MIPVSFCLLLSLLEGMERTLKGALFVQIGFVVEIPGSAAHPRIQCCDCRLQAADCAVFSGHSPLLLLRIQKYSAGAASQKERTPFFFFCHFIGDVHGLKERGGALYRILNVRPRGAQFFGGIVYTR